MTSASGEAELSLAQLQRRTLRILVVAQVLSGVGLTAGITVGGLLGDCLLYTSDAADE